MGRNNGTSKAALPLMSFRPPDTVQRALNKDRATRVLPIEKAYGPMNIDNYRVEITKLPAAQTAAALFRYLRKNLNQFMAAGTCLFSPYPEDRARWFSDAPLGSKLSIHVYAKWLNIDDGSVVCSDYSSQHWVFSTIAAPNDSTHPVSGNREFGYQEIGDKVVVYTMACDRVTLGPEGVLPPMRDVVFSGGHRCWLGLQSQLVGYVNRHGGKARAISPSSMRVDWDSYKASYFRPTTELIAPPVRLPPPMSRPPRW
jgi:hypothetical protein